ncbi:MAG: zinc-binding dehydrogenase [Pirellulales bacterium]|nr:zinc-binding dehydrogenase [Pirellulales bacterium]
MKALTLTALKEPLQLQERPDLQPGPDEVVVQLRAAAVNRRDYWITQGLYPGIKLPVVLGSDGSGVVIKTGAELGNFWQGREVILNPGLHWGEESAFQSDRFSILGLPQDGTFATQVVVAASQLRDKPDHLDWFQAAALPLAGVTAWRALFTQGNLQAGESVLITGIGGGVATLALQFAVAAGANVWVTSSSPEKIAQATELGARGGFNYAQPDWVRQMENAAGAPHLIIDGAGGPGYQSLLQLAAPGGRIVNYGATAGRPENVDLFKVFWKQLRLQGSTMGSPQDFASMLEFVNEKRLAPIVDEVTPLAEGDAVVQRMKSSPQFGKCVLSMDLASK